MHHFSYLLRGGMVLGGLACLAPLASGNTEKATAAPTHADGKVVLPDGSPVAGASVRLIWLKRLQHTAHALAPVTTDKNGAFDIPIPASPQNQGDVILLVNAKGGVGIRSWEARPGEVITVRPVTSVRLRAVDSAGKPVPHARFYPTALSSQPEWGLWDYSIDDHWTQETDANGEATFPNLPQNETINFEVANPEFATLKWDAQVTTPQNTTVTEKSITVDAARTISGSVLYENTNAPVKGVLVSGRLEGGGWEIDSTPTDEKGNFAFTRVPPGDYKLDLSLPPPLSADWIAKAPTVNVEPGKDVLDAAITLTHGALLTGKITDEKTGAPLAGVNVMIITGNIANYGALSKTDGTYQMRVLPGDLTLYPFARGAEGSSTRTNIKIANGESKTVDFQCAAPVKPIIVHGVVRTADGAPASGVEIRVFGSNLGPDSAISDEQGRFAFDRPGLLPTAQIYARRGALGTAKSASPPASGDLVLTILPSALASIHGTVTDKSGKPVGDATITLFHQTKNQGGLGVDSATTDASGKYLFQNVAPDADYMVDAAANGYEGKFSSEFHAEQGKSVNVPALVINQADSFVGGTIVDVNGAPVANAHIRVQGVNGLQGKSDAQGKFHLKGVPRDKALLEVSAADGRTAYVQVSSESDENVITVKSEAEVAAESQRFSAMVNQDTTNHGDGVDAHVLLQKAQAAAKANAKPILLVFHATWCGPCFLLHRFLEDPKIKPVMDAHFVVQDLDIWEHDDKKKWENPGGTDIYKQYGGPNSIPYAVMLNADGVKIGDNTDKGENMGMPSEPGQITIFLNALRKASPSLTDAEITQLREGMLRASKV